LLSCGRNAPAKPPSQETAPVERSAGEAKSPAGNIAPDRETDLQKRAREVAVQCDLILSAKVTAKRDYTAKDGGKGYDVLVSRVYWGKYEDAALSFVSRGWVGYADFKEGENVVLFLKRSKDSGEPFVTAGIGGQNAVCQIEGDKVVSGPLGQANLKDYLEVLGRLGDQSGPVRSTGPAQGVADTPVKARRVHVFISGRVQGVGFRDFTQAAAQRRGLTGWVQNLDDGRVEAVIEGPADKAAELLELVKHGPPAARVDKVETADETPTGEFKVFEVRR
jgi:acylphosphatase